MAIALYDDHIWTGDTVIDWPIGIEPMSEPFQSDGFLSTPSCSFGRPRAVYSPNPNALKESTSASSPPAALISWAILMMPTFDDSERIWFTDIISVGCECESWIVLS